MAHIFISYASDDRAVLGKVRKTLMRARRQGWIDKERIVLGGDYRRTIDDALRTASAVVVLLSPAATESQYVTYEWSFALGAGVRVIPVLIGATEIHPRLEALEYLDATKRGPGNVWERLVRDLRRRSSVDNPDSRSDTRVVPELIARFELSNNRPVKDDSSYKIWIGTRNTPEGTERVNYQIFHNSYSPKDRRFSVSWGVKDFADCRTSYGDIFLAAKGRGSKKPWRTQGTLVEALKRTYHANVPKSIASAISNLEAN